MDIEEFKRKNNPKGKSSKLDPYRIQIFDLKQTGYTNQQICEWLETIGEKITKDGLRKFIVSRQKINPKKDFSQTESNDKKPIQQKNLTPEKEPETFGSHDPRALDKIFASNNDLEALSKYEKRNRAESNSMKYTKQPTEEFGSHDPRALTAIFNSKPDLEALSRIAKKNRS